MIPEEMKSCIGLVDPPIIFEIEKGAIRRYAEAVGDDNPLYRDESYAANSRYGSIIAPPGFFGWPVGQAVIGKASGQVITAAFNAGHVMMLDAGKSYEFFLPVRPGDTLICSPEVEDVVEKEGKGGAMFIVSFKNTYRNQNGDIVANAYQSMIFR